MIWAAAAFDWTILIDAPPKFVRMLGPEMTIEARNGRALLLRPGSTGHLGLREFLRTRDAGSGD